MFIEFEDDIIPLSQIKVCRANADNSTTITTLDGKVLTSFSFYTNEIITKMAAPFVQTQPGYFKISIPEDDINDEWPPFVPIVAWRMVGEFDFAEPITVQLPDDLIHYAVLTPDGSVFCPSGNRYASRTEFLNVRRAKQAQVRARTSAGST